MANALSTMGIDNDTVARAEDIFDAIGMDIVTGINVYLKKVIAEGRIPFELSDDRGYSTDTDPYFTDKDIAILSARIKECQELGLEGMEQHDLIEV